MVKHSGTEPDWFRRVSVDAVDLTAAERRSTVYKGVMCLILRKGARDFLTGQKADLHTCQDDHIFPREVYRHDHQVDIILNRTLISKETNNRKRNKRPSEFFKECLEGHDNDESRLLQTLETHFINKQAYEALMRDDFDQFIRHREACIIKAISEVSQGIMRRPSI
jgi:hypothetical protein